MSMIPDTFLGIDPGASGGLAALGKHGDYCPMPKTEPDTWSWFAQWTDQRVVACIERVGGFIAGNPTPGSAMFNFGWSYGGLRMALIAASIPFQVVQPKAWQKFIGMVKNKGESQSSWKGRLKGRAQEMFPRVKVTLQTADALLIAHYCQHHPPPLGFDLTENDEA